MMKRFARYFVALSVMVSGFGIAAIIPTATASAACTSSFLTFPAWYDGVIDSKCEVTVPKVDKNGGGLPQFIFRIVLNIIEIALQLVAYAAAGYLIYGGFKYLTSAGSADRVVAGRKIILNAIIGLVISFMSVAIVNLVTANIDAPASGRCNTSAGDKIDPNCVGISKVDSNKAVQGVLTTVYYAAGAASVIVIIVSSIFYVISQGDPAKTKRAKDGILYAVVGLVIVLVAFIITNFIIGRF